MGRLSRILTDFVWVKEPTGAFTAAGVPAYSTAVKMRARVESTTRVVKGVTGSNAESSLIIAIESVITKSALVFTTLIATSDNSNGFAVLQVKHSRSPLNGEGHWEILV